MKPTLVVMAAGMGSRFGGLKQVAGVGPFGEIVLEYSIYDAIRAGFGRVVFVIRKDIEAAFREVVEPRIHGRIPVDYAFQELAAVPPPFSPPQGRTKPWGTGQAVLVCRNTVREPFAVINADDFYGARSFSLLAEELVHRDPADPRFTLVAFRLANTLSEHGHVSRGVCTVGPDHRLLGIQERTRIQRVGAEIVAEDDAGRHTLAPDTLVSMNLWGFTPALFASLANGFESFLLERGNDPKAEFYLPAHVDTLIRSDRATVSVAASPELWLGITYPDDRPSVAAGIRKLVASGVYPERLWT